MPWESVVYRRSKLYEQVWLEPVRSVARCYGISDGALSKICRKLEVPLPGRGRWARKAAGQEIPRAPLPELKKGQSAQLQSPRYVDPSRTRSFGEDTNERIRKEAAPAHKIVVPETLIDPHPLVRSSAPILRRAKFGERPMATERCLDISATGDALNRALRVVVDMDPRFKDWLYLAERRLEALEKKARTDLLDRSHNLSYSSPLRQRFAWAGEASTADLVNVVLFPYRQKPDDPDDTPA